MGKLRAKNGHAEPYRVVYWGIGNEMYGNWQIGHVSVEEYIKRHNEFVDAFRKQDSQIKVIGSGNVGKWDEAFLAGTAKHLDLISEHFYVGEKKNVAEHVRQVPNSIKRIADAHRQYRKTLPNFKDVTVPITMDEWNYWYGEHVFGELGTRYFIKDGLGIAAGLHEFFRNSDIYAMANYAQTVNVIGCIKTNATSAQFETTGLVLKLYRNEFGSVPLKVTSPQSVDAMAALTDDGKIITVGLVNPSDKETAIKIDAKEANFEQPFVKYEISDNDPMSYNDPAHPQKINIVQTEETRKDGILTLKPYSVTVVKIGVK